MQNLSLINSTLIGLCCIAPGDREYANVHSAWENRYDPLLLVDAVDRNGNWCSEDQIVQELTNLSKDSGGRLLNGKELLIVLLLDLSAPPGNLLNELDQLQRRLFQVFKKHCSGLIAFAHAGSIGQEDALYERKQSMVYRLLEAPISRIFLIAADHSETDGSMPWQTAMLLGDMLRRSSGVLNAFSDKQRIGFLEYSGYHEAKRELIGQKLERNRIRLESGGRECIKKELNGRINDITSDVEHRYVPLAECQPSHELVSPKNELLARIARFRDPYCYELAEESVRKALTATGNKLREDILKAYAISADEATRLFCSFTENVAMSFLLDKRLVEQELRLFEEARASEVILPEKIGSRADTQAYLTACAESAIAQGKNNYVNSVRTAYAALLEQNVFQEELDRLEREQLDLDEEYQMLPDLISFCEQTVVQKRDLDSPFPVSFSGNGQSQAVCVCELNRADLLSTLSNAETECRNDMTSTLFYQFSSMRTRKRAEQVPISMLRLKLFDISSAPNTARAKE